MEAKAVHHALSCGGNVEQVPDLQRVQSLPRWHRLTRRPDFTQCYEAGCRYFSRHFVLFVYQRQDGPPDWRMGLAVTKKLGNAVARNRIKRVLRAFFRLHQQCLPPRMDIVAVPKRHLDVAQVNLHFVSTELASVLDACTRARIGAS